MHIKIIKTIEEFNGIKSSWNELLKKCSFDTVFFTHEWIDSWWRCFGRASSLFIITVWKNDSLVGIAPLMIKNQFFRKLQFISENLSDYLDFIVDRDQSQEIFTRLLKTIRENYARFDWIEFKGLSAESPNIKFWQEQCAGQLNTFVKAIYCDLSPKGSRREHFESSLPKKRRNDLKRTLALLKEAGEVRFECFTTPQDIKTNLPHLIKLHKKRWGMKHAHTQFDNPYMKEYFITQAELLAPHAWIELSILWHDYRVMSAALCYTYKGRYYYYLPAFNPAFARYSPGNLLIKNLILYAYDKKFAIFDLIKGAEPYKYSWANNEIQLYKVQIFNGDFRGKMIRCYSRLFEWVYVHLSKIDWIKKFGKKLIRS